MTSASPTDSKAPCHHSPQNWHSETAALFTMSRDRAEEGIGTEGGGRGSGRRTEGGGENLEYEYEHE
jgi:hypothetical protein